MTVPQYLIASLRKLHTITLLKKKLEVQLVEFDFKVVETSDKCGSQAILIEHKDYVVLAFRGTESDSLSDIKADAHIVSKAGFLTKTEAVTLIHCFGSALNLNIHFHMLFLEGVISQNP
ncbi:MAG: hypothetical protein ACJAV1_003379 [Paraglaciecola sp.]|jgi:hypothetical protein